MSDDIDAARDGLATAIDVVTPIGAGNALFIAQAVEALCLALIDSRVPVIRPASAPTVDELERILAEDDGTPICITPKGRVAPADVVEAIGWAIVQALHEEVDEAKRPMAWSDLSGHHEARARAAALAAFDAMVPVIRPPEDGDPSARARSSQGEGLDR